MAASGQGGMATRTFIFPQQSHHGGEGEGEGRTITLGLLSQKAFYRTATTGSHVLSVDFCSCWLPLRATTKKSMDRAIVIARVSCNTSGTRADYHTTIKFIFDQRTYILCGWTAVKYQADHSSYWRSTGYLK